MSPPVLPISPPNRPLIAKAIKRPSPPLADTDTDHCVYRATACSNPRATSADGVRHKFCQFHLRQTSLGQRQRPSSTTQRKTLLFRDPSRVPASLLRQLPQTKLGAARLNVHVLPRLHSHDVLRRALLKDHPLPVAASSSSFVRPLASHIQPRIGSPKGPATLRLPSFHTLVPLAAVTSGSLQAEFETSLRSRPSHSCHHTIGTRSSQIAMNSNTF